MCTESIPEREFLRDLVLRKEIKLANSSNC